GRRRLRGHPRPDRRQGRRAITIGSAPPAPGAPPPPAPAPDGTGTRGGRAGGGPPAPRGTGPGRPAAVRRRAGRVAVLALSGRHRRRRAARLRTAPGRLHHAP